MESSQSGTVALVVASGPTGEPVLLDAISDDYEVSVLIAAIADGESNPLENVYEERERLVNESEDFSDYVEELVTHPMVHNEIREQGIAWLKSKIKIDEYRKTETEATKVIAKFAFDLYCQDPDNHRFVLNSFNAQVNIRVFIVDQADEDDDISGIQAA